MNEGDEVDCIGYIYDAAHTCEIQNKQANSHHPNSSTTERNLVDFHFHNQFVSFLHVFVQPTWLILVNSKHACTKQVQQKLYTENQLSQITYL